MTQDVADVLCGRATDSRVLIVAAHPDDETIAAGARLHLLGQLTIVHVTDGSPRSLQDATRLGFPDRLSYAKARREELATALACSGCQPNLMEFEIPDQDAVLCLPTLVQRLADLIVALRPRMVLTHPYEGGHPDHDACAFAVREAVDRTNVVPVEFTSYHLLNCQLRAGEFLPGSQPVLTFELSPEERQRKRRMLDCFVTQHETLRPFGTDAERFRVAPNYDFTVRPHPGPLNYERFGWGITGNDFTQQVRKFLSR